MVINKMIQLFICPVMPVLCIGDRFDLADIIIFAPHMPAHFAMQLAYAIGNLAKRNAAK